MSLPTKYFSTKQENLIASTLGWKVVSGSGSRDFNPGDIECDEWLGECKTHTTIKKKVVFKYSHWAKINEESKSKFKYGVLFVDDGSQKVENTYCLFDPKLQDLSNFNKFVVVNKYSNQASFDKVKLDEVLATTHNGKNNMLVLPNFNKTELVICHFSTFLKFLNTL